MNSRLLKLAVLSLVALMLTAPLVLLVGCGEQQPKVMVFMGKSSKSYETMKPIIESLEKKFKDKVTFIEVDYDDPNNKGELEKYHVSMNPTVIIFNTKGEIKQTYMGAAREDMIEGAISSFIPQSGKPSSSGTASSPQVTTTPATPYPPTQSGVPITPN